MTINLHRELGLWIILVGGITEFFVSIYIYLAEIPFSANITKFSIILMATGIIILLGSIITIVTWRENKQMLLTIALLTIYSIILIIFGGFLARIFNRYYGNLAEALIAFFFASLAILAIGVLTVLQYINLCFISWDINEELSLAQIVILMIMILATIFKIGVLLVIVTTILPADTALCMLQKIRTKIYSIPKA